jgi:hypothetical protein
MPNDANRESLRNWKAVHIDETIEVLTGYHEDELFYNCTIKKIKNAVLKNCCMTESKFAIDEVEDMLGLHMGLDCSHFSNVEFSEQAFDYLVLLMVRTKGNTAKRLKIIEALGGKQRVAELLNAEYPGNRRWER